MVSLGVRGWGEWGRLVGISWVGDVEVSGEQLVGVEEGSGRGAGWSWNMP